MLTLLLMWLMNMLLFDVVADADDEDDVTINAIDIVIVVDVVVDINVDVIV